MRKAFLISGFLFLSNLPAFSQIDYSSVDTTVIPHGLFSELIEKFHGIGEQRIVHLDYDAERKMIIYAIEWESIVESGNDLMLIAQTDNGLVRKLFTGYSSNFRLHFEENYLYIITERQIEIYNMNEISKPIIVPHYLHYKLSARLICSNLKDFECSSLELIDNEIVVMKKRNINTNEIVEETFLIENGKFVKI
jgi:uncharacterized secreted protein with C-terminal beta-propeller domain